MIYCYAIFNLYGDDFFAGNETIERIATYGMQANFTVYLFNVFNLGQVTVANVLGIANAVSNCMPIIGGTIADAFLGKFKTIALASIASLLVCFPPLLLI